MASALYCPQFSQHPLDFLFSVVMHEADAEKSPVFFNIEPLGQIQGVVIAVPGEDATLTQARRKFKRSVAFDSDRESRAA